jgi:hypothetical protein
VRSPTPGEDREARVLHGDVVDQLHDEHGLADARAAEETDLAAAQEGLYQVDDLDARLEHLHLGGLLVERGRVAVYGVALLGVDRPEVVHGLADDVEDAAQRRLADGDGDAAAGVCGDHAAHDALGRLHRDGADAAFAEVLLDFGDDVDGVGHVEALAGDAQGRVDGRQVAVAELHVEDGADDLDDLAGLAAACAVVRVCGHTFSQCSS